VTRPTITIVQAEYELSRGLNNLTAALEGIGEILVVYAPDHVKGEASNILLRVAGAAQLFGLHSKHLKDLHSWLCEAHSKHVHALYRRLDANAKSSRPVSRSKGKTTKPSRPPRGGAR